MFMTDQADPGEIAASATRAARFQDIVMATSRTLNGQDLVPKDRMALQRCQRLLSLAGTSDFVLSDSATTQSLADPSATLAVLRAAGGTRAQADYFERMARTVGRILRGNRTPETLEATKSLRDLFIKVNEMSLDAAVEGELERQSSRLPIPSTANSIS